MGISCVSDGLASCIRCVPVMDKHANKAALLFIVGANVVVLEFSKHFSGFRRHELNRSILASNEQLLKLWISNQAGKKLWFTTFSSSHMAHDSFWTACSLSTFPNVPIKGCNASFFSVSSEPSTFFAFFWRRFSSTLGGNEIPANHGLVYIFWRFRCCWITFDQATFITSKVLHVQCRFNVCSKEGGNYKKMKPFLTICTLRVFSVTGQHPDAPLWCTLCFSRWLFYFFVPLLEVFLYIHTTMAKGKQAAGAKGKGGAGGGE